MHDCDNDFLIGFLVGSSGPEPDGPRSFMGALVTFAGFVLAIVWLVTR